MDDLELAASLVRDAGQLAAQMVRAGLETEYKTSVSDVVSAADHAAEQLVSTRLAELRPKDGVVGEEGSRRPGARTWYIDPVDGTYNFLSGIPYWCSALALVDEAGLALGAVYYLAVEELWLGGRGHPTTCNGIAVPALAERPLSQVSLASYLHPPDIRLPEGREAFLAAAREAATLRMFGSGSVDLAYVAGGRIGVFLQANCPLWDWLPGAALVEAAGGVADVVEVSQVRWHVAGNRQAVAELAATLADRKQPEQPR